MKRLFIVLLFFVSSTVLTSQEDNIEVPGRIAFLGEDFNVYVLDLSDNAIQPMTDDANNMRHYLWPTWSTNDKLAYFCCDAFYSPDQFTEVYISPDGVLPGEEVTNFDGTVFQYAYWSPADCGLGDKCRDLAVLISGIGGLEIQLVRNFDEVTLQRVGFGAPFYHSWSPGGDRILLQRNNEMFDLYDVIAGNIEELEPVPGLVQSPDWSPVDDRLLLGALGDDGLSTDLLIWTAGEINTLVDGLPGLVGANWSPDGSYVAYRTVTDEFQDLVVLDSQNGELISSTKLGGVVSFFWSPDSSKIAFVSLATPPDAFSISLPAAKSVASQGQEAEELAWWVLDVSTGEVIRYASFVPTGEMIYIFNFFDQFAQSHSLWSPDSTHIVFAEVLEDGSRVISLLDTTQADTVPFSVANGVIGIWSYR